MGSTNYDTLDSQTDLGSFEAVESQFEGQRMYYGHSSDFSKFKANCTYCKSGTIGYCADTGEKAIWLAKYNGGQWV